MKVTRIDHVSLNTHGAVEETQRFYEEFLGLSSLERPSMLDRLPGGWLQVGDSQVHLIGAEYDGKPGNPIGPHYAVRVDDLDAAVAEIEERGLPYRSAGEGADRQVWITDPAGNTIEFQQERR